MSDPQAGKSVGGPRTFATVQEFLWYNFSPVCQLSFQKLYSRANGDLLQENVCHMPCLPGLLQPEPLSLPQATADTCHYRRHANIQMQVRLSVLLRSLLLSLGPGVHEVLFAPCSAGDPCLIPGSGRSAGEGIGYPLHYSWASLVAQLVKNLPAMQETPVWFLGWEDLLEKG